MTRSTRILDGARALGIGADEVASAEESPGGLIVATTDGVRYIVVPAEHPDDAGRSGVMFVVAPTYPYHGTFPVYAQPQAEPSLDEPPPEPGAGPADGTIAEVLARVGEDRDLARSTLEAESARAEPRSSLVRQLAAIAERP